MRTEMNSSTARQLSIFAKARTSELRKSVVIGVDLAKFNTSQLLKMSDWLHFIIKEEQPLLPVAVFSKFELGWIVKPDPKQKKESVEFMKSEAEYKWKEISTDSHVEILVTDSNDNSTRGKVEKLIQFSKRKKAELIVTASQARSEGRIIGLGSFTGSLITLSPLPVLVMGENLGTPRPIKKIFFPTDLSEHSKDIFKKVLTFAKDFKASIKVFHYLDIDHGPSAMGIPWGYELRWIDHFWRVQEEEMRRRADELKRLAEKENIDCECIFERASGSLRNTILSAVKNHDADMLVATIKRGPVSQVMMGRTVRDLFAECDCPVLAIHTTEKRKRQHH